MGAAAAVISRQLLRLTSPDSVNGVRSDDGFIIGQVGSGLVVGSLLLHDDGIDFRVLTPTWLAIGLFVALPTLFGLVIGPAVDRVGRPGSWTRRGRIRWWLPIALVAMFPLTVFVLVIATGILALRLLIRPSGDVKRLQPSLVGGPMVRAVWFAVATLGAVAIVSDVAAIAAST